MSKENTNIVNEYKNEDECPHEPGTEEYWQESWAFFVWDTIQEVYVFLRLSQVPNKDGGQSTVWLNAWTPEYTFHHSNDALPFGERTKTSLTSGQNLCRYEYDGNHNWQVNHSEVSMNLVMKDKHAGMDFWTKNDDTMASNIAREHTESNGPVTGTVTVKGKSYEINGTGWRDHSWSHRDWNIFRVHRGFMAIFEDMSIYSFSLVNSAGELVRNAVINREGQPPEGISDYEITAYMSEDGVSNKGGTLAITIDGERQLIEFEPVGKASVSMIYHFPCVDTPCKVRMGDKVGVGFSETSHRTQGGTERPRIFPSTHGIIDNGLHKRY
tara:strand:- start:5749 stop:6726 length:978 start_codon:yes stop_codon:yes gene_type:complete